MKVSQVEMRATISAIQKEMRVMISAGKEEMRASQEEMRAAVNGG
jgi:hypothetical protein